MASNLRVDVCAPMEPRQAGCCSSSFKAQTKSLHQNHGRPIPICSLWCTIWSAPCSRRPISPAVRGMQKLFARVLGVIKRGYADPDFGPHEVAARTGISLRYLQKLFTQRGSTCSELIYSLRLDHAARLLGRRELLRNAQPLSEIGFACGFRDYTHFARKFRHRFGHPPGAHSAENGRGNAGSALRC